MITKLWVETKHGNTRVLHGIKDDRNEQTSYNVEFVPNKNSTNTQNIEVKGQTILKAAGMNDLRLISFDFELKRGLYDVYITKVKRIDGSDIDLDEESRYQYEEPVMVGNPYTIQMKKEETVCYGEQGVRVRIASMELPLDSETVYYQIKRENVSDIRYYVPFNQQQTIDFFIKGVKPDEIEIFLGNSSFQIENNVQ